jgi:hypothetical protein
MDEGRKKVTVGLQEKCNGDLTEKSSNSEKWLDLQSFLKIEVKLFWWPIVYQIWEGKNIKDDFEVCTVGNCVTIWCHIPRQGNLEKIEEEKQTIVLEMPSRIPRGILLNQVKTLVAWSSGEGCGPTDELGNLLYVNAHLHQINRGGT